MSFDNVLLNGSTFGNTYIGTINTNGQRSLDYVDSMTFPDDATTEATTTMSMSDDIVPNPCLQTGTFEPNHAGVSTSKSVPRGRGYNLYRRSKKAVLNCEVRNALATTPTFVEAMNERLTLPVETNHRADVCGAVETFTCNSIEHSLYFGGVCYDTVESMCDYDLYPGERLDTIEGLSGQKNAVLSENNTHSTTDSGTHSAPERHAHMPTKYALASGNMSRGRYAIGVGEHTHVVNEHFRPNIYKRKNASLGMPHTRNNGTIEPNRNCGLNGSDISDVDDAVAGRRFIRGGVCSNNVETQTSIGNSPSNIVDRPHIDSLIDSIRPLAPRSPFTTNTLRPSASAMMPLTGTGYSNDSPQDTFPLDVVIHTDIDESVCEWMTDSITLKQWQAQFPW